MKCDNCDAEMAEVFGFDGVVTKRQVMGHYCPECILYVRKDDGRKEETRIIEQPEK